MGMCNSSPVLSSIRSKAVSMFSLQFSPACDTLSKRQTAGNLGGSGSICGGILMANHPVAMQGLNPNCQSYVCLNRCSLTHWVLRAVFFFCSIIQHLQSLVSLWYIELAYSTLEILCRPTWLTILGFIFVCPCHTGLFSRLLFPELFLNGTFWKIRPCQAHHTKLLLTTSILYFEESHNVVTVVSSGGHRLITPLHQCFCLLHLCPWFLVMHRVILHFWPFALCS